MRVFGYTNWEYLTTTKVVQGLKKNRTICQQVPNTSTSMLSLRIYCHCIVFYKSVSFTEEYQMSGICGISSNCHYYHFNKSDPMKCVDQRECVYVMVPVMVRKVQNEIQNNKIKKGLKIQACILRFWKGKGTKVFLFLGKRASYMKKLYISTGAFQGHQGNDGQGHRGIPLRCLREESGLKIPTETKHHTRELVWWPINHGTFSFKYLDLNKSSGLQPFSCTNLKAHRICASMVFFLSLSSCNFSGHVIFCLLNVGIHLVQILVFDNYQRCPVHLLSETGEWFITFKDNGHYW